MQPATVIFLHGFASSAQGTKAQFLRGRLVNQNQIAFYAIEFNPTPRDFEFLTISGMINRLRQYLLDRGLAGAAPPARVYLVGSSMGGLVGLNYAHRFGGIAGLLLLAPALSYFSRVNSDADVDRWQRRGIGEVYHHAFKRSLPLRYDLELDGRLYAEPPEPPCPTLIVHGRQDQVVPVASSKSYAEDYPDRVRLVMVDASHSGLNNHLDLVWRQLARLLTR